MNRTRSRRTRPARRRPEEEPSAAHDRWLVSYADFITLLFAFFTTMYAVSTVDAEKLDTVVGAQQIAFATEVPPAAPAAPVGTAPRRPPAGPIAKPRADVVDTADVVAGDPRAAGAPPHPAPPAPDHDREPPPATALDSIRARLEAQLDREIARELVDVQLDSRGLVVSIRESGSFETGSAELSAAARALVTSVARTVRELPNDVRIEGHTDDAPIQTPVYASNWELSTSRATSVVAYLIESTGIDPWRLSAAGYSEYRPRLPNDSPASRQRNRRVDIVILEDSAPVTRRDGGLP